MLGWYLSEIRREDILKKDNFKPSEVNKLIERQKQSALNNIRIRAQQNRNPFTGGRINPWARR